MIQFKPSSLSEDGTYSYSVCGDPSQGICKAKLDGIKVFITSLENAQGDAYVVEGLIRSVLNFAANRNAFTAYASPENMGAEVVAVLTMLGFEDENGMLVSDIPDALAGSCCRCK